MRAKSSRSVALLIESSRAYGRGLLRGITHYARTRGHWSILYHPWELDDKAPPPIWLTKQKSHGVIARIESPALWRALRRLKVPVVNVRRSYPTPGIPMISTDDRQVVQLAVAHLRERGFRRLAYCGFIGVNYSVLRRDYFLAALGANQDSRWVYEGRAPHMPGLLRRESEAILHERELATWLASLPKPIGLLACNDIRGRQVLNACHAKHIAVPDEIAVLGVDNDEVLCELADPPLSSVILAAERVGYEAAALLEKMMDGFRPADKPAYIAPLGVATRRSTEVLAVEDRRLAEALRFIREHACEGITVEDVLDHLAAADWSRLSRSSLERGFAQALRCSPKDEILRVRLQRARQLLVDTDWKLTKIARHVGVAHAEYFSALFKSKFGATPARYRRRMRFS